MRKRSGPDNERICRHEETNQNKLEMNGARAAPFANKSGTAPGNSRNPTMGAFHHFLCSRKEWKNGLMSGTRLIASGGFWSSMCRGNPSRIAVAKGTGISRFYLAGCDSALPSRPQTLNAGKSAISRNPSCFADFNRRANAPRES